MSSPTILLEKLFFETNHPERHRTTLEAATLPNDDFTLSNQRYERTGYDGLSSGVKEYVKEGAEKAAKYFLEQFGIDIKPRHVSVSETKINEKDVLGRYDSLDEHIDLDTKKIREYAKKHGVDERRVLTAVAGHEYIHTGQRMLGARTGEGVIYEQGKEKNLGSIGKIAKRAGAYAREVVEGIASYISGKLFGTKEYPLERAFVKDLMREHGEKNVIRGDIPRMGRPVLNFTLSLPKLSIHDYVLSYRIS